MRIRIITGIEFSDLQTMGTGVVDNQIVMVQTTLITWGGPIAIFRWDNINDMDVMISA
jgi:hypothetical protein